MNLLVDSTCWLRSIQWQRPFSRYYQSGALNLETNVCFIVICTHEKFKINEHIACFCRPDRNYVSQRSIVGPDYEIEEFTFYCLITDVTQNKFSLHFNLLICLLYNVTILMKYSLVVKPVAYFLMYWSVFVSQ